jgi:NADPH:quinone reductase-like Zn-dependent oxidoreductase/SAM-dependent methyltransferase
VNGSILYPATGTFIMALEAATQVAQKNRPITGFYVKEAIFSSPIVLKGTLEGDQTVETITSLRSLRKPYEKESAWSEIWISTYHNGTWSECFRATIQTQYAETSTQVDGGMEQEMTRLATLDTYHAAEDTCAHTILSDRFYDYCDKRGLRYGESFRILEDIRWDEGSTAIGRVDVSRASTHYQGLVHPAVIDAACQIFWIAPSSGLKSPMPTEVPHRFFDAYLSTSSWKYPQTTSIRIWSTSSYKPVGRGVQGALSMLSDDGSLLCRVKRVEMDPIADDDLSIDTDRKLLYGIDWEPCLSALEPSMLQQLCNINDESAEDEDNMQNYFKKLDEAIRFSIHSTLAELSEQDRLSMEPHLVRYTDWLQRQLKSHPIPEAQEKPADELEKIFAAVETMRPSWSMFMQVARNLTSILRGTVDPLSLIFSTDLAEDFYTDIFANICDTPSLRAFIELAAHENPELRILEVGAGTGGMTKHVLSALQQQEAKTGGNAFAEYVYSDISMAFFEKAKTKFDQFASRMSFKVIDLEEDIIIQAIEPKAYDIVVAGSVLHATETLHTTLKNIRKVLKPGGKLVFMELILPDALAMNFGFGVLPGWWRSSEDWRAEAQGVTEDRWNALLKDAGFSGNDLVLRDYRADELHNFSIIATTAVSEVATKKTSVVIVLDRASTTQRNMVVELRTWLLAHNEQNTVKTLDWKDLEEQGVDVEDIVISIVELDRPILHELDEGGFSCLRSLVGKSKKLLWVSSADLRFEQYSYHGLATGFFRTLRSEALDKQIVTLCLEGMTEDIAAVSQHIERIFQQSFIASDCEVEYVVRDNVLQVARLKEEPAINEVMLSTFKHRLRLEPFGEGPPLVFDAKNRGTLDSLEFSEDLAYQPGRDLGDYEVEVEAKCWGLNFRDVFIALGRLEENDLGFDCAGVVLRAGPRCRVKKGDRVVIAVIGCMRSYIICEELEVIRIPDSISFEDAAAICAPGVTAYHSLVDVARLQKGERILIHSASGATGQVAVQIAKWVGAEVFVTVGSDEKRQFLQDTYSIPRDHIFYSRNTSFAAGVMRMTGGEGVHVVLNSLSGDGLRVSWECVAEYGRFVEIGKVDIKSNSGLPMIGFSKNISFSAVDLFHISQTRKSITRHLLKATMSLYQDGHIHPPQPVHKFSVSKMEEAFRFFQTGKNTGRVVITIEKTDIVPVSNRKKTASP